MSFKLLRANKAKAKAKMKISIKKATQSLAMSETKRRQVEERRGRAMAATSCRSRRHRQRYAQNKPEPKCLKQIYVHAASAPGTGTPRLAPRHIPIEAETLMLAHLHLTENTFNKRDLRNSCSSVKVRLGLLFVGLFPLSRDASTFCILLLK